MMRSLWPRRAVVSFRCAIVVLTLGTAGCTHSPRVTTAPEPQTVAPSQHAWVELIPQGASVRAIVPPGAKCPKLKVDGNPFAMKVRAEPASDFNVRTCEALLPQSTASASIDGQPLPVFPKKLEKVIVLGDTGCRIAADKDVQDCNSSNGWPFAAVAKKAAEHKPDLVIAVGDYYYREIECPEKNQKECGGSPWGDNWPTWKADFFDPATPLLAVAPWVIVRGNHEAYEHPVKGSRGYKGWFRFLDPGAATFNCSTQDCDDPSPWAVQLPDLQLIVLNTSGNKGKEAEDYKSAYKEINKLGKKAPSWLLMHHPLWAFEIEGKELKAITNKQQKASQNSLASGIELVLSGHVHLFEALGFQSQIPPNVVAGTGGTVLHGEISKDLTKHSVINKGDPIYPQVSCASSQFGFTEMVRSGEGWDLTFFRKDGGQEVCLRLEGRKLTHTKCPAGDSVKAYCYSNP